MKRLRDNRTLRPAAWALFAAAVCAALLLGQQFLFALWYTQFGDWTTTWAFDTNLNQRTYQVQDYVQLQTDLDSGSLDYVEREQTVTLLAATREALSPERTNFRYQILSADGTQVLDTNLQDSSQSFETQVTGVYYGVLTVNSGQVDFTAKSEPWTASMTASYSAGAPVPSEDSQSNAILRYGVLKPELMVVQDEFRSLLTLCDGYAANGPLYGGLALVFLGAAVFLLLFLLWAAGHRPGQEGIVLSPVDRVFSEVWLAVLIGAALLLFLALVRYRDSASWILDEADQTMTAVLLAGGTAAGGAWVLLMAAALRTLVVRIKARALARTTLLCRVVMFLARRFVGFFRDLPLAWKAVVSFFLYLAAIFACDHLWPLHDWYPVPGVVVNLAVLAFLCWWSACFWRVRKGTEVIAAGNLNHQIETARLPGDLKRHAEALNNISGGLTQAVNEQMKSERFKAELITNVSHDLKTPLTSIINYVNLLKTTEQTDPTARQYIDVLDRKSQRLKKLTEDLVEASKASTGALSVNREKIGMVQLLDQALGEYEEKLEGKHLAVVRAVPEGECYVYADGRHLWRVIDNLLSNCAKYALEGTRVYIEIFRGKGSVSLSVKNVSRDPLNVPPERLMERFVRGEESRTTEGLRPGAVHRQEPHRAPGGHLRAGGGWGPVQGHRHPAPVLLTTKNRRWTGVHRFSACCIWAGPLFLLKPPSKVRKPVPQSHVQKGQEHRHQGKHDPLPVGGAPLLPQQVPEPERGVEGNIEHQRRPGDAHRRRGAVIGHGDPHKEGQSSHTGRGRHPQSDLPGQ